MDGDKSGESGVFLFSQRVPDFCDGRRPFPTNENSILYRWGRWRWISLITNPQTCWAPVPLSRMFQFLAHFPFPAKFIGRIWVWLVAFIRYIWDGQQKVKSPIVSDFPDLWKPGLSVEPTQKKHVVIGCQTWRVLPPNIWSLTGVKTNCHAKGKLFICFWSARSSQISFFTTFSHISRSETAHLPRKIILNNVA